MGQFFDWRKDHSGDRAVLPRLKALHFIYSVKIKHNLLTNGVIDNPEIIEITQDEWTGIFWPHDGYYEVLFKSEIDAMAFKLTFL